ncbi:MAG: cellulase [Lentisphaerae bacterium]|nr:MAG: cellulase [Lentisphaerota bacterium]
MNLFERSAPLAIAMWDFSWLERRWPGAGYEDWDQCLDELVERGYNAVRIDAYPHLIARDPTRVWEILPCWNQQCWGSPARNRIRVQPELNTFLRKCRDRGILVGLSTWFQRTEPEAISSIVTPQNHADIWLKTLASIEQDGLLETILYLDICNEWPFDCWAPFFRPQQEKGRWAGKESLQWIGETIDILRRHFPHIPYTCSYSGLLHVEDSQIPAIHQLDFLEAHLWMVQANEREFYRRTNYHYERFDPKGYDNLARYAEDVYRAAPHYWQRLLTDYIDAAASEAERVGLPLITTECWAIVDYKDWPLLSWDWVLELCALGTRHACAKGQWLAIATSNFCGPQFTGMWREVAWHQNLTREIRSAPFPPM